MEYIMLIFIIRSIIYFILILHNLQNYEKWKDLKYLLKLMGNACLMNLSKDEIQKQKF